jgi:hypothetical protein
MDAPDLPGDGPGTSDAAVPPGQEAPSAAQRSGPSGDQLSPSAVPSPLQSPSRTSHAPNLAARKMSAEAKPYLRRVFDAEGTELRRQGQVEALEATGDPQGSWYREGDQTSRGTDDPDLLQKPVREQNPTIEVQETWGEPRQQVGVCEGNQSVSQVDGILALASGQGKMPLEKRGQREEAEKGSASHVLLFCRLRRRGYLPFVFCGRLTQPTVDWAAAGGGCFIWTLEVRFLLHSHLQTTIPPFSVEKRYLWCWAFLGPLLGR